MTLCIVQNATGAEVEVPVLRGSQTYEPAPPVAVQPGPVFVRQTNRFLQQGIFLEFGTRYWFSTGTLSKDLSGIGNAGVVSRLTYKNLTAHSLELFGSIKQVDALFLKWNAGFGKIVSGSLIDEDFSLPVPPFATAFSRTTSDQGDGSLSFATLDLGYNFVGWTNFQMGGFIGYNFLRETVNAVGCAQQAGSPDVCVPPIATSTLGITERADWSSFRVGVAVDWFPLNRLKLSGNFAWVPFTALTGTDSHALRPDLPGNIPESAHGHGVQLDALASYAFTDSFNLGLGLRYWYLRANGGADFTPVGGFIQPESFKSQRFGVFLQGAYTFGVPGKMHRPQWLSCC
jgi:hypothetical protein